MGGDFRSVRLPVKSHRSQFRSNAIAVPFFVRNFRWPVRGLPAEHFVHAAVRYPARAMRPTSRNPCLPANAAPGPVEHRIRQH
jgi:hypothetical protein